MGIDFRIRDFARPTAIFLQKAAFNRSQWQSRAALQDYQLQHLKSIIAHAYNHVPYYRDLFANIGLHPNHIQSLEDLHKIPFLTKNIIQRDGPRLYADNMNSRRVSWITTSGTTGSQLQLCMDKSANVLEFVYYWRLWGMMGYRLGNRFAELSAEHFAAGTRHHGKIADLQRPLNRLMLNSLAISRSHEPDYRIVFDQYRPMFLKGLPSNLFALALVLGDHTKHHIKLKAVFCQGENLLESRRRIIEDCFCCRVIDSYGHMERTVAIAQCPQGRYHVHPDYGIAEFADPSPAFRTGLNGDDGVREIIGTSLHNRCMPLLRYRTGDLAVPEDPSYRCPCGRQFPVVKSLIGRSADVVITPDGRAITALYTALDKTQGLTFGRIIQKDRGALEVHAAFQSSDNATARQQLFDNIQNLVGTGMHIRIIDTPLEKAHTPGPAKSRIVESRIPLEEVLG